MNTPPNISTERRTHKRKRRRRDRGFVDSILTERMESPRCHFCVLLLCCAAMDDPPATAKVLRRTVAATVLAFLPARERRSVRFGSRLCLLRLTFPSHL
mmetsp:Transcript_4305/g.14297  ORF Transcript_4305/g.14297 Transcript_4305/m.14297 type:complete len:99 (+) Transcript_4305:1285-1581(+)